MNLNVNYRLCLVTMHQCKFIDFNECTALVGDVNSGKGCAYVGHQVYGSSRLLPAQVCWEPKTVLNNTVYLLKCFEDVSNMSFLNNKTPNKYFLVKGQGLESVFFILKISNFKKKY